MEEIKLPEPYARMPRTRPIPDSPHSANAVLLESVDVYTADQVRAAILAERERCAKVCEESSYWDMTAMDCAAAIRQGTSDGEGK